MTDYIIKAADECGIPISQTFGPMIGACPVGDVLERFYAIAFAAGMVRAAEIAMQIDMEAHGVLPVRAALIARHIQDAIRAEAHAQNQPKNEHDSGAHKEGA